MEEFIYYLLKEFLTLIYITPILTILAKTLRVEKK
jgi:hypothetical protein